MTRLEKLLKLRQGVDYPNVDSLAHRTAVRDFLVMMIDEEITREQLPLYPPVQSMDLMRGEPLGAIGDNLADLSQVNRPKGSEPNTPPDVISTQTPETKP